MNKTFPFFLAIILSFSAFSQNLVLVKDYSKNFSKDTRIQEIKTENQKVVIIQKDKNNQSIIGSLLGENILETNQNIVNYNTDKNTNDNFILESTRKYNSVSINLKKYSLSDQIIFEKIIELQSKSDNFFIDYDNEKNIYIAGSYIKFFNIDKFKAEQTQKSNIFILKLNSKGEIIALHTINSSEEIQITDFKISQNSIFITGTFEKELNTLQSNGRKDAFVSVLNTNDFSVIKELNIGSVFDD
ncbi:MAG: hypothetical protein JXL97_04040 [Bacteroidales bacterium]|nr:hypothetical protein [Bacteroidales bacterium]